MPSLSALILTHLEHKHILTRTHTHLLLQGAVHRDLSPKNILVHKGKVLLSDFGLALYTMTEAPVLTAHDSTTSPAAHSNHNLDGTGLHTPKIAVKSAAFAVPDSPTISNGSSPTHRRTSFDLGCCSPTATSTADGAEGRSTFERSESRTRRKSHGGGLPDKSAVKPRRSFSAQRLCNDELMNVASGTPLYTAPEVCVA